MAPLGDPPIGLTVFSMEVFLSEPFSCPDSAEAAFKMHPICNDRVLYNMHVLLTDGDHRCRGHTGDDRQLAL